MWLVRIFHPDHGVRLGVHQHDTIYDITGKVPSVSIWLQSSSGDVQAAINALARAADEASTAYPATMFDNEPGPDVAHWLAPVDALDVWAAGVTYERSRAARQEEADDGGDVYARVYQAERPEIFFKARGEWAVGHRGEVGIRSDAKWNVPEPELTLVANPALEIVGMTVGNDMSSRDIEGENPLYLPQAKIYTASCALGHGILLGEIDDFPRTSIRVAIRRQGELLFFDETNTAKIQRHANDLMSYLGHSLAFPNGVALMTGTGIVPPGDFTLQAGDTVHITIDGVGELVNRVKVV
ncbi:MAG: fumarylacetoacetate hydrolase family protein [Anaerolineae bacterium]|nr:fumarylacetoacetate hydrolase family protein [Anaerolineae bacterium]